jgi:hypothetical protein
MQALYKHILTVIYGGRHHDHQESQGTEKLSKLSKVSQQSSRGLSPGHLALEFMPITRLFILESEVFLGSSKHIYTGDRKLTLPWLHGATSKASVDTTPYLPHTGQLLRLV